MSDEANVGSLVPQLFYDLISRVVPGIVMIPALLCSWWGPIEFWARLHVFWSRLSSENSPGFLLGMFLLAIVYFVGVALRGLAYCFYSIKGLMFGYSNSVDMEKYYRIKVELPGAGSRVAKMKAEVSMAEVFIIGFIICLLLNLWGAARGDAVDRLPLTCMLILCSVSFAFFRAEVKRRLVTSVNCHYAMLTSISSGPEGPQTRSS